MEVVEAAIVVEAETVVKALVEESEVIVVEAPGGVVNAAGEGGSLHEIVQGMVVEGQRLESRLFVPS